MKLSIKLFAVVVAVMFSQLAFAQKDKSKRASPPAVVEAMVGDTKVTVDYSQPSKKDREIFGSLVPFGKVWRTGANETTWIEFSKDVKIQGKDLKAGKYGLHTIPGKDEWTIIFNSVWQDWGSYKYKESNDVLRVKAKSMKSDVSERFTIKVDKKGTASLVWDTTKVEFTIK